MDTSRIIISRGYKGRKRFLSGLKKASDILNATLGANGLNTMYESDYNRRVDVSDDEYDSQAPTVTNDGVKIASRIVLDDPIEDLAAQALFEVAKQQNTEAGDATTTVVTMYASLVNAVFNKLSEGGELADKSINRMELKREIEEAKDEVIKLLRTKAKPIKTQKDLENVAMTAGENESVDKKIAEAWWTVGKDGWVGVEGHKGLETEIEVIDGMKINAKMVSEFMVTNDKEEMNVKNALTVVTNHNIDTAEQVANLSKLAFEKKKFDIVLFAPQFSKRVGEAMNALMAQVNKINTNSMQTGGKNRAVRLFGIRIPTLTEKEGGQVEDLAIFTGSTFIDKNKSMEMQNIKSEDLGSTERVFCDGKVAIIGKGDGDTKKRIQSLTKQMRNEKDDFFKKRLQNRIGALSSGMATVKAGATTDTERRYIKLKADDTVYACRNAWQEGFIKGGGYVLKALECKNEFLKTMLEAPYKQIKENAGGTLDIPKWVSDPVLSETIAIERAVSMAGMVITTDTFIAYDRENIDDKLELIAKELKNLKK